MYSPRTWPIFDYVLLRRVERLPTVQETASVFLFLDCISAYNIGEKRMEPGSQRECGAGL